MQTVRRLSFGARPSLLTLAEAKTHGFTIGLRHRPPGHFIWHYHPEIQVVWSCRGHGLRIVGKSVERFAPGDLVLIGANLPHLWAAADQEAISTVIHFLPDQWGADFWRLPEVQRLRRLLAKAARGLRFTGPEAWKTGRAIEDLAGRPVHDFESLLRFLAICGRLASTPCHSLNALPGESGNAEPDPRLQRVLEWTQRRAAEPITQQQAAAEVGMTPAGFSRWFKRGVGQVFHRHLNELRVAMVCARLSSSQGSITEAAFQCGYNNLANFNRRFREITGVSPSEFRLRTRQMQQDSGKAFVMQLGRSGAVRVAPMTATSESGAGNRQRRASGVKRAGTA